MGDIIFQYDRKFYEYIEGMKADEKIIMPFLMNKLSPASVVDFGCGEGLWLKEALCQDNKIEILGVDGNYVEKERLKIPVEKFFAADLRTPIFLNRRFELAISTEVAEHLDEEHEGIYLDNIARASDQIFFTAAVPGQMGVNHINEQWQSYWIKKFKKKGYYCDFSIRDYFWNDGRINGWRRQNILFFSKKETKLVMSEPLMDVLHPEERARVRNELKKILKKELEIQLQEHMDYVLLHPEVVIGLEQVIEKLIPQRKKIVIYPYGRNGQICERLLCVKYHVNDYILADNNTTVEGKQILRAKDLKEIVEAEQISVIDTCSNPSIHREVLDEISKYVDSRYIYSAFEISETGKEHR